MMRQAINYKIIHERNIEAYRTLFRDSETAWVDPEGTVYLTPLFGHLEFFVQHPEHLEEITDELLKHADGTGKLELDTEEMASFVDRIYARGWGRIGTFAGDQMELDCATDHLRHLRRMATQIGKYVNRKLVCHVTEPDQNPKRKVTGMQRGDLWSPMKPGFIGWLSPDGTIHETPPKAPFSTFIKMPDLLPEIREKLTKAVRDDEGRQCEEFNELFEDEDHMPWHQYNALPYNPDEIEFIDMAAAVLAHGWGRLEVPTEQNVTLSAEEGYLPDLLDAIAPFASVAGIEITPKPWPAVAQAPSP